jgi:hypothetical protein
MAAKSQHRKKNQSSANRQTCDLSANVKHKTDVNLSTPAAPFSGKALLSPYVNDTAKDGSKRRAVCGESSWATHNFPAGSESNLPLDIVAVKSPTGDAKIANTFTDSVISLCTMSLASCADIGDPVPENIFLALVRYCGIHEAKFWADVMGFKHEKSYALLSKLIKGV